MPQKARPDKIAKFNPEAKVASPPIDYSKTRAITDKPWLVACVAITVAFFAIGGALSGAAKTSFKLKNFAFTPSDYMKALGGTGAQLTVALGRVLRNGRPRHMATHGASHARATKASSTPARDGGSLVTFMPRTASSSRPSCCRPQQRPARSAGSISA